MKPTQCHLWQKANLEQADLDLETLKTYFDNEHAWRYLQKCRQCGQLYVNDNVENIDWMGGDDQIYTLIIPVLKADLKKFDSYGARPPEIMRFKPFIVEDPEGNMDWLGKDDGNKKLIQTKSMHQQIKQAFLIALAAHEGQKRKTENIPYIAHPVAVALTLARYGFSSEAVAAALVHDVLEDTEFPEAELEAKLGRNVLEIVKTVSHLGGGSWEVERATYLEQVRRGIPEAKAVCCADKINNVASIIEAHATMGGAVWERFSRGQEKQLWYYRAVLEMLKSSWNHSMIAEYEKLVAELEKLGA